LRTIVIDPGHGGNDTGTQNKGGKLDEKVFTLDVAKRLQRLLGDSGWKVVLTRDDDRFVSLPARAEIANKAKADLFISIHFNAVANNPSVKGTETYVLTPRFQRSTSSALPTPEDKVEQVGNRHDAWSAVLGAQMHRHLLGKLKTEDRGYKRARFAVLRLVDCPSVLVEAGYLSNGAEARKLASESYRGDIAEALATAIQGYAAALDTAAK
jgi:N-acetylmuramoyl-L-alanine amidase